MPDVAELTDHQAAEAIRDGALPSPTKYGSFWLYDLRITGTGPAWRESLGEWAYRDPELWTSPELVQRCNGLQVIELHPENSGLNSEEFNKRAIGSIVLPYVKQTPEGPEVWGIAKIFDADAAAKMQTTLRSTSPGVTAPKGSSPELLEGVADPVLNEGLPQILDHLAVCEAGVWDKGGPAAGVRLDAVLGAGTDTVTSVIRKGEIVTEEEAKALKDRADAAEREREDAKRRADAAEAELNDRKKKDAEMRDKARRDARRKHESARRMDAGEKEESEEEMAEREDRHKKDRAKRHDGAKHDGELMDCSRCDAEEDEEAEKAEKERKDAAAAKMAEVNATIANELRDAKERADSMAAAIKALEANQQPMNHDDADRISRAYHRADSLFGMLGEKAPQHYPGEKPRRYEARLATSLQKFLPDGSTYKSAVFNDSLPDQAFGLMEKALYDEVYAEAKNPTRYDSARPALIAHKTTDELGRTKTTYTGSSRAGLGMFVAPSFAGKIVKPERV